MNAVNHRRHATPPGRKSWRLAGCAAAALALVCAAQAPAFAAEQAVWVKKNLLFIYHGFTSNYSCEGLQDTVTSVLLQLGARKSGMDLRQTGCSGVFNVPSPNPGVSGSFYVLEPASGSAADAVDAEWQTVNVRIGNSDARSTGRDKAGTCEIIDQVKKKILPLFSARNVKFSSTCYPNTLLIKGSTLQAEVLKARTPDGHDVAEASQQTSPR